MAWIEAQIQRRPHLPFDADRQPAEESYNRGERLGTNFQHSVGRWKAIPGLVPLPHHQTAMDAVLSNNLFADYRSLPNVFDEMLDQQGVVRPPWPKFIEALNRLGTEELKRRNDLAELQIANHGVTFNPYDLAENSSRPWALDSIPLLIPQAKWDELEKQLAQRATLLDLILRDLFGPQTLLKEKLLPPCFLYGHPGYFPAYHGLADSHKRHLHLYAADLARSPDGNWWVTSERTRAPFGLGYVLENRIITSGMLPEAFRDCQVKRLAPFFLTLQKTLHDLAPNEQENPHTVLWTKGPESRSYFEDAYLARYLGYTLVQGADLAVRQNRLMLKTLGGLVPVDVVFRRLNDDSCDPVELDSSSSIGVSSFLEVVRAKNVAVANVLGSRLVESPLLKVFLPRICQHLLGQPLQIPSVATWWCGQENSLTYVLEKIDDLLIRDAFRMGDLAPINPSALSIEQKQALIQRIKAQPEAFVAQQRVSRSTAPVWNRQQVQPWPVALRSFLVASSNGYQAMAGGLARVAPDSNILDHSPTSGEKSQDVWVISDQPLVPSTLLPSPKASITLRRSGGELPSRVADTLFWLGRNIERAESSVRLMRLTLTLMQNERDDVLENSQLLRALAELGQIAPDLIVPGIKETLPQIEFSLPASLFSDQLPLGFRASLNQVVRLASNVRDRISVDAWRIVHNMDMLCDKAKGGRPPDVTQTSSLLDELITKLMAFAGMTAESTTRTLGWSFLDLGRRIERAWQTAQLLRVMLRKPAKDEQTTLEAILQVVDSLMTYRSRYMATMHPMAVCDLLITDDTNPRSIAFQLRRIEAHIDALPREKNQIELSPDQKLVVAMNHSIRLADPQDLVLVDESGTRAVLAKLLGKLVEQLPNLSDAVASRFLIHAGLQRHFATVESVR